MELNEVKLLDLLLKHKVTFFIPPYQRNYEWTEDQCKVFLDDVIKTAESNAQGNVTEHFFGTITYFQSKGALGKLQEYVLIDGQQRLTTTMLFLAALRDFFSDEHVENSIDSDYLKNDNMTDNAEFKIKLKQVETDWKVYKTIILSESDTKVDETSDIYKNYRGFKKELEAYAQRGHDLAPLIENGIGKFSVITIELEPQDYSWENPQEIFESMNSLGKPLSLADLVRNYLLLGKSLDEQTNLYKKYWLHIEQTIPKKVTKKDSRVSQVSNFIRDYMQIFEMCSYKKATKENTKILYSIFKNIFSDTDTETLLKNLAEYSDIYRFIISDASSGNTEIDHLLSDLRKINTTTAYSFLLELLHEWKNDKFSDKDIVIILRAFFISCFRRRILGSTKAENKAFPTFVKYIPDLIDSKDKKAEIYKILSNREHSLRLPNDVEMTRQLQTMNFYNFKNSELLLAMIEEKLTKSRPDLKDKNLQKEHIMPQTLDTQWEQALGDDFEEIHTTYVHTIGNITLIRHNQELGNQSFAEKKKIYENNAGLQIARSHITDCDKWTETEIEIRADWIIDYLLSKVLAIPKDIQKANNNRSNGNRSLSFVNLELIGKTIAYYEDPSIVATVVSDNKVMFEEKEWSLSGLTRELKTREGTVRKSGSYEGPLYWTYNGVRLKKMY